MKSSQVENDTQEYPCLIRVTHAGKNRVKVKFSTQVSPIVFLSMHILI